MTSPNKRANFVWSGLRVEPSRFSGARINRSVGTKNLACLVTITPDPFLLEIEQRTYTLSVVLKDGCFVRWGFQQFNLLANHGPEDLFLE